MQDTVTSAEFAKLLRDIWSDLQEPAVLWQIGTLLLCLGLGWLIQRAALRRGAAAAAAATHTVSAARRFGEHGVKRVIFPLSALLLVLMARGVLARYHNVSLLDLAVPLLSSLAAIRFVVFTLRQAIGRSSWLGAFERFFATLAWLVVALHIVGWLPEVIDSLESVSFTLGSQKLSLWTLLQGLAMVMLTLLLAMWVGGALERRLALAVGMDSNLRVVLARVLRAVLIVVAVLVALPMVGIDLTTLSVFGGALGVGLGFGLQKIAANYVSGFILLLDRSLRIGNLITVGTERGIVKEITTRYTVIRAANGVESIVPNETLVGSVVQNETFSDSQVALPLTFQVGYEADLERAMGILIEVALQQPRVLKDPVPKAFLASFGDNGINLRLGCWIADPEEGTLQITSDINMAVWRRFKAEGISIPFPQREVRLLGAVPEPVATAPVSSQPAQT
ncbi:mechanosensitive ion channel protein MscS [Azoarcus sp. DD4]|uniref:mechanosensitive ion channel family protein n=1 Tax=Azoarcus sp. DD4 TaxID=2027405 RepID=UPI00112603AD|nr:mechanosensitive ion channel domain-containing protein [Azoarcus sp. DD4]QDF98526.1 mechanosensitive ion channel protein MscS [Azoarcus sp. DD4]